MDLNNESVIGAATDGGGIRIVYTRVILLSRLFAFILVCIGVQIVWNGISELWGSLPPQISGGFIEGV